LAEIVEDVLGLIEREITGIEQAIGKLLGLGEQKGKHQKTHDLIVPLSGPKGSVNPAEFSLVQVFDVGWLLDSGYQRLLDTNLRWLLSRIGDRRSEQQRMLGQGFAHV
jgi:hypothetical protein